MSAINIYRKEKDKFVFDLKEFSRILGNGQDSLIAIYSVVGQRDARNDILVNFFCNYFTKFDSDTNDVSEMWTPCAEENDEQTAGIWMYPKPFLTTMDSKKVSIFLLNSRLSSESNTSLYDNSLVLTMTTLLSSQMVYNHINRLNEDILEFFRHSTVFARYELNDDQPFQKLIFVMQECTDEVQQKSYYSYQSHNNKLEVEFDLPYDCLGSQKHHSKRERSVRSLLNRTFIRLIELEYEQTLQYYQKVGCLWGYLDGICNMNFICVKKIGEEFATGPPLLKKVKKWSKTLEKYTIPSEMSAKLLSDSFYNQMALNSAIDYYYYEMNYFISNPKNYCKNLQKFQKKVSEESIKIFKSYPLSGGKAFERPTICSFWENLNENQNYFNKTKDGNKIHSVLWNQSMNSFEFQLFDKLMEEINNLKTQTNDYKKNDINTKLKDVIKEVTEIKEQLHLKEVEKGIETVAGIVSNVIPYSSVLVAPLTVAAKFIYKKL